LKGTYNDEMSIDSNDSGHNERKKTASLSKTSKEKETSKQEV